MIRRRNDNSTSIEYWSNKKILADLKSYVRFENASFAFPDAKLHTIGCHEPREDSKGVYPDEFIKERTRLYF